MTRSRTLAAGGDIHHSLRTVPPPIDYDRCTNCMQGLSFCVFDVDGIGAGRDSP
jgi:Pyruvate/2-oxoacid:ferredoxin oxidoreductase delta subunit